MMAKHFGVAFAIAAKNELFAARICGQASKCLAGA